MKRQDDRFLYLVVGLAVALAATVIYFGAQDYLSRQAVRPPLVPAGEEIKYAPPDGRTRMDMPRLNPGGGQIAPAKPRRKTLAPPPPPVGQNS